MKVTIVISFIAFFLYALFGYQLDKIRILTAESAVMKNALSGQYLTINKLEDYRKSLNPPAVTPYSWPVELSEYENISSYWALRNDPLRRGSGGNDNPFHNGVDMTGIPGAQVLAVADGVVLNKYYEAGVHYVNGYWREYEGHKYFNGYVEILHDNGMISKYGHVAEILVYEGERVEAGQQIAQISQQVDKYSTGPHLDFRLQDPEGNYVNPMLWIGKGE